MTIIDLRDDDNIFLSFLDYTVLNLLPKMIIYGEMIQWKLMLKGHTA